uniref:Uncharacterized protein n=1 Tax=Coccolithus braarudii TaxID=221442 RepID=A0A7S0LBT2_9EUKA|mmetsp:Transcript_26525/g.57256  ORF Transcript_26525/g.57256 Transcript_26525/m.57256 type:complete len:167 (+) Transcript_26525:186-686(+)
MLSPQTSQDHDVLAVRVQHLAGQRALRLELAVVGECGSAAAAAGPPRSTPLGDAERGSSRPTSTRSRAAPSAKVAETSCSQERKAGTADPPWIDWGAARQRDNNLRTRSERERRRYVGGIRCEGLRWIRAAVDNNNRVDETRGVRGQAGSHTPLTACNVRRRPTTS